jgi:nitroreductase
MSFIELARKRHSVRAFKPKRLTKSLIESVLEAGRIAPSACNNQPWLFLAITDLDILTRIKSTYPREWLQSAPAIIVVCGDHHLSWKRADGKDHCDIDIAICIDHITLAAIELGLGTCWVCAFDAKKCHEILSLPRHIEPIALLPIGYPLSKERDRPFKRKEIAELVHWNKYTPYE